MQYFGALRYTSHTCEYPILSQISQTEKENVIHYLPTHLLHIFLSDVEDTKR